MSFSISRECQSMSLRCTLFLLLCCTSLVWGQRGVNYPVVTVSAASYEANAAVAPGSIAATFGTVLTTVTMAATDTNPGTPAIELPTDLGGTTVQVNNILCGVLYVSPTQINFVIPEELGEGIFLLSINANGALQGGTVKVARVQPSLFAMNSDGQGVLAASVVRIKADGSQQYESAAQFDAATNRMIPKPIELGPSGERVFLEIYLTGIRQAQDENKDGNVNEHVFVLLGGKSITPAFAGKQGFFAGIDQVNVELPRTLIGKGKLNLSIHGNVTAPFRSGAGFTSNAVELEIAPAKSATPPTINNISVMATNIGDLVVINGNGFGNGLFDNVVTFGGIKGDVEFANSTQLAARIPFGAKSGKVKVVNAQGEAISPTDVSLRTSLSGLVETSTSNELIPFPLQNITVRVAGTNLSTTTNQAGRFILNDVPSGVSTLEIDPSTFALSTRFSGTILKTTIEAGCDNALSATIWLKEAGLFSPTQPTEWNALTGVLTDTDGVTPVPNAMIRLLGQDLLTTQTTTTDNSGSYVFRNVASSTIVAEVIRANGKVLQTSGAITLSAAVGKLNSVGVLDLSLKNVPANRKPIILASPPVTMKSFESLDVPIYIFDSEANDTLQVLVSGVSFASLIPRANGAYLLHLSPPANTAGVSLFTIELKATDSSGNQTIATIPLTIILPKISVSPTATTKINEPLDILFSVSDFAPNSEIQVSVSGMQNASFVVRTNGNYTFRFTPTTVDVFPVTIKAMDTQGVQATGTIIVTVLPTISLPTTATVTINSTIDVPFSIYGFDTSPQVTASGIQNASIITGSNGNYTLRLNPTIVGIFPVEIKAIDAKGNQAASIIKVGVTPTITQGVFLGTIKVIPVGAPVRTIAYDPNHGFYIGVYKQGIFKSLDNGETWPINLGSFGQTDPRQVGGNDGNKVLLTFSNGKLFTASDWSAKIRFACQSSPCNYGGVYQSAGDNLPFTLYWGKYSPAVYYFYFNSLIPFGSDVLVHYSEGSYTGYSHIHLSPDIEIPFGYRPIATSLEKDGELYLGLLALTQTVPYVPQTSPLAKLSSAKTLSYLDYPANEIYGLASDGNIIYALDGGVSLSYDNGTTWNTLPIQELNDGSAQSIVKFNGRLVVSYSKGLLVQSTNKMEWQKIPINFEGHLINKMLVKNSDIFCITTDGVLYKISRL